MANTLGALVVRLGLDAAEFVTGMTKSEREAQKFARALDKQIAAGAKVAAAAIAGLAVGAVAAAAAIDRLAKQAGDFQDMGDKVGDSAAAFASLAVSAKVGGLEMDAVAAASLKLTKSLVGVDDESKAAGAAVKALGLDLKAFKDLAPSDQIEAVAKALSNFADGPEKAAVAMALFGKTGADMLPFLKELSEGTGRANILTAEQIKLADEYADKQAKVRAELDLYAQALATQGLKALTAFTGALADSAKELVGIDRATGLLAANNGVQSFAIGAAKSLGFVIDAADGVGRIFEHVGKRIGGVAAAAVAASQGEFARAGKILEEMRADVDRVWSRDLFSTNLNARLAQLGATGSTDPDAAREAARFARQAQSRPRINFSGAAGTATAGKSVAEKISEAERYAEQLAKQLAGVQELTVYEKALAEIQSGRLGKVTPELEKQILAVAKEVDATREAIKVSNDRAEARKRENEAIEEFIRVTEEADRARLKSLLDQGPAAKLEKQRQEMMFLAEAMERGRISAEQFADAATGFLGLNKEMENTRTLAEDIGLTFSSAFEDAVLGGRKFSEVLKGLEQDILRIILRKQVTEPLGNAISGMFSSGGGGGGGIVASFFSNLFGGARAIGGPVEAGKMYRVNERAPELLDVNGRQFLMMGSQRGRVTPMSGSAGGSTVIFNVTVPAGTPRETATQLARLANQQLAMGQRNM